MAVGIGSFGKAQISIQAVVRDAGWAYCCSRMCIRNDTEIKEVVKALPYWFDAAYEGKIPKQGNTLIHIDGHIDLAPPKYFQGYPLFRWPLAHELKYLIQQNDVFIQGASMTGLISRLIWIWPDWDQENHDVKYGMNTLSLGSAIINDTGSLGRKRVFCMCDESDCLHLDDRSSRNGTAIPKEMCNDKYDITVEQIHETEALSYLSKEDCFHKAEHIILDIDEDFYGVTYAVMPLLNKNVSMTALKTIDSIIDPMFCPKSTYEEKGADDLLVKLITEIIEHKSCHPNAKSLSFSKCSSQALQRRTEDLLLAGFFHYGQYQCTTCFKSQFEVRQSTEELVNLLKGFTVKQLQALQKVGFCRATTPKSFLLHAESLFGICYGRNTPELTAVITHLPDQKEIMRRSILLTKILHKLKRFSPQLVTLCRSVRDGYTPRQHFDQIEKDILTALNITYDRNIHVHYDLDLLGGKEGWPSWHK